MLSKISARAKFLFNYEYANFTVVIFYLILIVGFMFQEHFNTYRSTFNLITSLIFLNTIHVIFQYWLIERSEAFNSVLLKNIKMNLIPIKMMMLTIAVFLGLVLLKISGTSMVLINIVLIGLASRHGFGQTYGLYCAKRLNSVAPQAHLKDLRALKLYVYFAVAGQIFLAVSYRYKSFFPPDLKNFLDLGFMSTCFIWLAVIAFYVARHAKGRQDLGWMFARFLMIGFSFVSPIAIFAMAAIHGAEYFDVVQKVRVRSKLNKPSAKFFAFFALALSSLVAMELYAYFLKPSADSAISIVFNSLIVALTLVHYLFDSFAYKMQHAEGREKLISLLH